MSSLRTDRLDIQRDAPELYRAYLDLDRAVREARSTRRSRSPRP